MYVCMYVLYVCMYYMYVCMYYMYECIYIYIYVCIYIITLLLPVCTYFATKCKLFLTKRRNIKTCCKNPRANVHYRLLCYNATNIYTKYFFICFWICMICSKMCVFLLQDFVSSLWMANEWTFFTGTLNMLSFRCVFHIVLYKGTFIQRTRIGFGLDLDTESTSVNANGWIWTGFEST